MPSSRKLHGPEISVVFPLFDPRGDGLEAVRSWACSQTLPRERYQVIAVSDGSDTDAEERVARVLAPHDFLIRHPTQNFIELYDVGLRAAEGRLVVLTEHHCLAQPDCLAEVVAFFQDHELEGACLNIEWVCANETARLKWHGRNQERLSFFATPDHWNKFHLAGVAVVRDVLLAAGGIEYQYGLFVELGTGAKLHSQGYRLGNIERAVVQHFDNNNLGKVLHFIRNFTEGEIKFLASHEPEYYERYIGRVPEWGRRHKLRREAVREVTLPLARALWRECRSRSWRRVTWLAAELVRRLPATILPARLRVLAAYLAVIPARLRFALWWFDQPRRSRALIDACNRTVHHVRLKTILGMRSDACSIKACSEVSPDAVRVHVGEPGEGEGSCVGCHAREVYQEESFRWTEPVAVLRLAVPPGDYEVMIETRALRGAGCEFLLACFWNHHHVKRHDIKAKDGRICFNVRHADFNPEGPQHLTLICEALVPRRHGVADDRRLGMPVFSVRFGACNPCRNEAGLEEWRDAQAA
jgi:hypothetical protein